MRKIVVLNSFLVYLFILIIILIILVFTFMLGTATKLHTIDANLDKIQKNIELLTAIKVSQKDMLKQDVCSALKHHFNNHMEQECNLMTHSPNHSTDTL